MTYACEDFGFLFYRVGAARECPPVRKITSVPPPRKKSGGYRNYWKKENQLYESRRNRHYEKNT